MIGSVTVGTGSTEVVARRHTRNALYLSNDSDEDIYIAIGEAAVLNQGIILQVGMSPLVMRDGDPGLREQINAICSTGSKSLAYLER